jgi:hypothetical protein
MHLDYRVTQGKSSHSAGSHYIKFKTRRRMELTIKLTIVELIAKLQNVQHKNKKRP